MTSCESIVHIQNEGYIIYCDSFQEYLTCFQAFQKKFTKIVFELNSLTLESNKATKLCGTGLVWMTVCKLNVEFGMLVVFVMKSDRF